MDKERRNILNSDPCAQFVDPMKFLPLTIPANYHHLPDGLRTAVLKLLHTDKLFKFNDYLTKIFYRAVVKPDYRFKWIDGYTEFLTIPELIDYFIPEKDLLKEEIECFDKNLDRTQFDNVWENRYMLFENYGDEDSYHQWISKRFNR